jgi:hypothetical protein
MPEGSDREARTQQHNPYLLLAFIAMCGVHWAGCGGILPKLPLQILPLILLRQVDDEIANSHQLNLHHAGTLLA